MENERDEDDGDVLRNCSKKEIQVVILHLITSPTTPKYTQEWVLKITREISQNWKSQSWTKKNRKSETWTKKMII